MRNYNFAWEVQTLLEQFIGATNDIIVKRYDNQKTLIPSMSAIKVNYVYAPKSRVFSVLSNPAPGGIKVPVVSVSIASITRDNTRVFNKISGSDAVYSNQTSSLEYNKNIPQPVPINIAVNMTIMTKYQTDMDQIVSNILPYCDPYIIISWKMPHLEKIYPQEIRSEVLWNGSFTFNYPLDLQGSQPYRITADTSFTIKGWMFKKMDEVYNKIYVIDSDYTSSQFTDSLLQDIDTFTDSFSLSARPQF